MQFLKYGSVALLLSLFISGCSNPKVLNLDKRSQCVAAGAALGLIVGPALLSDVTTGGLVGVASGVVMGNTLCRDASDADFDGVFDRRDECPNTPIEVISVDKNGCPLSDVNVKDKDSDGVPDDMDQCPNTPPRSEVNTQGCSHDSDNDGVLNEDDHCPRSVIGWQVDRFGCGQAITLRNITFRYKKSTLSRRSERVLEQKILSLLENNSELRILIIGHTDSRGSEAYNRELSLSRANATRRYLLGRNISGDRIKVEGRGESEPVASNDTDAGRALNRRVEFHLLK